MKAQEEDAPDKFERAKADTIDAQPVRPEESAIIEFSKKESG